MGRRYSNGRDPSSGKQRAALAYWAWRAYLAPDWLYNEGDILTMVNHLVLITVLCYLASFAGYATFLATERREAGLAGTIFLWAGVLMHYFALLERSRRAASASTV